MVKSPPSFHPSWGPPPFQSCTLALSSGRHTNTPLLNVGDGEGRKLCFLMRIRLEICAREKVFIVKSLLLHVVTLTCKGITLNLPCFQKVHVHMWVRAHVGNLLI